jgi:hypothetical protein
MFEADVAAVLAIGKQYVLGETNSGELIVVMINVPIQPLLTGMISVWWRSSWGLADFWWCSVDHGLLASSDIQQHLADLLPPGNRG